MDQCLWSNSLMPWFLPLQHGPSTGCISTCVRSDLPECSFCPGWWCPFRREDHWQPQAHSLLDPQGGETRLWLQIPGEEALCNAETVNTCSHAPRPNESLMTRLSTGNPWWNDRCSDTFDYRHRSRWWRRVHLHSGQPVWRGHLHCVHPAGR